MDKIQSYIYKITAAWVAIGTLIITFSVTGTISVPQFLVDLFSQESTDLLKILLQSLGAAIGSTITFYQFIRAKLNTGADVVVKTLSAGQKRKFALNPFKLVA